MHRSSSLIRFGRIVALLVTAALAGYLSVVGLDEAAALAGVLGLFIAIFALLAPYLLPPGADSPASVTDHQDVTRQAEQSVARSIVRGHLTQVRKNSLQETGWSAPAVPEGAGSAGVPSSAATGYGGQRVTEVWVGGDLTQIDGSDGDVTIA